MFSVSSILCSFFHVKMPHDVPQSHFFICKVLQCFFFKYVLCVMSFLLSLYSNGFCAHTWNENAPKRLITPGTTSPIYETLRWMLLHSLFAVTQNYHLLLLFLSEVYLFLSSALEELSALFCLAVTVGFFLFFFTECLKRSLEDVFAHVCAVRSVSDQNSLRYWADTVRRAPSSF